MRRLLVYMFALLALPIAVCANAVEWPLSEGGNGHLYEVAAVEGGILWNDAKVAAEDAGGYLAAVTSQAENDFIYSLADPIDELWDRSGINKLGPWLGGYQPGGTGPWSWVTGESFTDYFNWGSSQPSGNGNYLNIYGLGDNHGSRWNDFNNKVPGYVIEYVPEPAIVGMITFGGLIFLHRRKW